jgi:hypothetical protein
VGYGLRIGIRANSVNALAAIVEGLPPGLQRNHVPDVDMLYSVIVPDAQTTNGAALIGGAYANAVALTRSPNFGSIAKAVEQHLILYLAEFAKSRIFIHAGVVGWHGRAVLIPGRSFSGKSTLVNALLRAGATYYSDEFALVDRAGRIHPYPRPINLRADTGLRQIDLADLAAGTGAAPLRAGLILLTHHQRGANWRPRRASAGEAMVSILTNTASARRNPGRALRTIGLMLAGARVLRGPRGEADATVGRLLRAGYLPA